MRANSACAPCLPSSSATLGPGRSRHLRAYTRRPTKAAFYGARLGRLALMADHQ